MIPDGKTRIRRIIPALVGIAMLFFSATASRAQNAATESKPVDSPKGTITGRVVTPSGDALGGAIAFASPLGIIAQPQSAFVDPAGNFKFDGLDAAVYIISAYAPGFVFPSTAPDEPRRYYRTGDSVTLTLIKGGVITGTVTTATNGPVVAGTVHAFRIRDADGQPEQGVVQMRERPTDDRGVYRIYGLPPGTYVVSAGGSGRSYSGGLALGAYDSDIPTYAPSATRDTAMEVILHGGEEITADIQYRGDTGQVISGTVAGLNSTTSQGFGVAAGTVNLTDVRSRAVLMSAASSSINSNTFAFSGVADGEYELVALQVLPSRETTMSAPRRVKVQGADVTGINLSLVPLASISARLVLETNPPANCVKRRANA